MEELSNNQKLFISLLIRAVETGLEPKIAEELIKKHIEGE